MGIQIVSLANCLSVLNLAIAWVLRGYFFFSLIAIFIIILLIVGSVIPGPISKYRYHIKFALILTSTFAGAVVLIPIYLLRPRNLVNSLYAAQLVQYATAVLRLTTEVRNSNILEKEGGALVCINHQSALDAWLVFTLAPLLKRTTPITKKEHLYLVPYGPGAWLAGVFFVDRSSPKAAYRTLSDCAQKMNKEKVKVYIFPEGTRNRNRGLLPFKRGAFKTAIMGQVPIIPVVVSPYYFVNHEKCIFDEGHVIVEALEPIPTKGMVDADHEALMERTRNAMLAKYKEIAGEIDEMSQKKEWQETKRPRLTVDGKGI